MGLKEYNENKNWNIQGFREVDRVMDIIKDYADEYNEKHHFQIDLSEADDQLKAVFQIDTTVLTIKIEK